MRQKMPVVLLLVVAVALLWVGAAWYSGTVIEKTLNEIYQDGELREHGLRIENRLFERGIFSSKESLTIDFADFVKDGLEELPAEINAESLRLMVSTDYQHGPLAGGKHFAAAVAHSRFRFSGELESALRPLFEGKTPLRMVSTFGFDGALSSLVHVPAGNHALPLNDGERAEFDWGEINLRYALSGDHKRQQGSLHIERLGLQDKDNFFLLDSARGSFDYKLAFEDLPGVYFGATKIDIAALKGKFSEGESHTFALEKLSLNGAMPVTTELGSANQQLSVAHVSFDEQQIGPLQLQLDFDRLHSRSLAEISKIGNAISSNTMAPDNMGELMRHADTLLSHSPRLKDGKLAIVTPTGRIDVSAQLHFEPLTVAEIMLMTLPQTLAKMHLAADLELAPEALVALMMFDGNSSREEAQVMTQMALQNSVQQGWLVADADGKTLRGSIRAEGGKMHLNEQPFELENMLPAAP